ncbi:MAG: nucleotidyltransferase domain-containing protein [Defluviitaleaceae bacterium]|nr:nucleotidyltransferase domain-containing protein [Defluviitaleaceae bacterium]
MLDQNIIEIIELASKYPVINRVGVFGSYVRNEQTKGSDIDILFDYTSVNEDSVLEILDYGEELSIEFKKINLDFDYVSYKGVVDSNNKKVKENILSEVVWVYER